MFRNILFPNPPRRLPYARVWNIGFRTAHIGVAGVLFGGHVFDISEAQLRMWLYLTIGTGIALIFAEAYSHGRWLYEGRGLAVQAKVLLLCLIPWLWDYRVAFLVAVIIIASVGSHMPARFRYFSILHGRVLEESKSSRKRPEEAPSQEDPTGRSS